MFSDAVVWKRPDAAAREDDVRPVVERSLHEVPFASHPVTPAVDRARTDDRSRNFAVLQQDPLERDLLRRVRPVTGLDGRLGLRNRNGELGEVVDALSLVERSSLVVGVHGSARDRDQRAGVEPEQLLRMCSLEWNDVDHEVEAVRDRQGTILIAVESDVLVLLRRAPPSLLPASVSCQPSLRSEWAIAEPTLPVPPRMNARCAIARRA